MKGIFNTRNPEGALQWMLQENMILRRTTKDPETYATVLGFILSDQLRDMIGSNIVKLVAKATRRRDGKASSVSIRDAFLTATIAAVLELSKAQLSEVEMMRCANIIFALLPIKRLEEAGLADRQLRTVARDRASVEKLQNLFRLKAYLSL